MTFTFNFRTNCTRRDFEENNCNKRTDQLAHLILDHRKKITLDVDIFIINDSLNTGFFVLMLHTSKRHSLNFFFYILQYKKLKVKEFEKFLIF